jgi:hypothetical protein
MGGADVNPFKAWAVVDGEGTLVSVPFDTRKECEDECLAWRRVDAETTYRVVRVEIREVQRKGKKP